MNAEKQKLIADIDWFMDAYRSALLEFVFSEDPEDNLFADECITRADCLCKKLRRL